MSWVRLDDAFAGHRKVLPLSDAAFRLHICALCWSAKHGTDGFIGKAAARFASAHTEGGANPQPGMIPELVSAGLWDVSGDGWMVHDFLDYNQSAAGQAAIRASAARRARRSRSGTDQRIFSRDGYQCRYCRSTTLLSIDHLTPPGMGGSEDDDNLVAACQSCNSRKGQRTPEGAGMVVLPIEVAP